MYYDELRVGQYACYSKAVSEADVTSFAHMTGDFNPLHVDPVAAATSPFKERIAHGMLSASILCTVYGMYLPGPGAIHLEQTLRFRLPVRIGDNVTAHAEIIELSERHRVRMRSWCTRQDEEIVLDGESLLRAALRPA